MQCTLPLVIFDMSGSILIAGDSSCDPSGHTKQFFEQSGPKLEIKPKMSFQGQSEPPVQRKYQRSKGVKQLENELNF